MFVNVEQKSLQDILQLINWTGQQPRETVAALQLQPEFWNSVLDTLLHNLDTFNDSFDLIFNLLQLLRNCVAGIDNYQHHMSNSSKLDQCYALLVAKLNQLDLERQEKLCRMYLQLISNLANQETSQRLYNRYMMQDQTLSSILFNGKDPRTHRTLLLWFRNSQNMGISIFDHPAHLSQLLMLSNSVSDDLLELLLLLLQPLLQLDQIPVYWHQLSPQAQLMLLKIVDALIQPDLNLTIPSLINTSHLFATTLLNFAKQPYTHLVDIPPHLLQMLVLLLEYFKWTTEHRQQEIQHLLDSGFVDTICHTLRYLNNLQKPINSAKDNQTSLSNHPLFRTKSDCIQILSNLASYGLHAPDVIRESGGLILILNHCIVDDLNPYIREYSILAIRYLTEHNLQNQQFISQLEAKGTVSNDVLDELKVTTELDTATGRIKINRAL